MKQEDLEHVKETQGGFAVKNLSYKKIDNIITGQVKDPYNLFPHLYEGWITAVWNTKGTPIKYSKGRVELTLKIYDNKEIHV